MTQKQNARLADRAHEERQSSDADSLARRPTKLKRILAELAHGRSLNRFEAERLGDHCLHSTVSAIECRHGIQVARREEVVSGYLGHETRCCRYWLDDENRKRAIALLGWEAQCAAA